MGVVESKKLAETILSACERAESEGLAKLDDSSLWKDEVKQSSFLFVVDSRYLRAMEYLKRYKGYLQIYP